MIPIEIDSILQTPVPVLLHDPDRDVYGTVGNGGVDNVVFSTKNPDNIPIAAGSKISLWVRRGTDVRQTEIVRHILGCDGDAAVVDEPWSPEFPAPTEADPNATARIIPVFGDVYRIQQYEKILLPRLGTDALIPWLDEITEERRKGLRKGIQRAGVTGRELAAAEASVELGATAVIGDLVGVVQTPAGIRRVIKESLARTELSPEKQAGVLARILANPTNSHDISRLLCGLFATFERREPPKPDAIAEAKAAFPGLKLSAKEAPGDPLPNSGAATASATPTTG